MKRNMLWFILVAALVVVAGCSSAPAPSPSPAPAPAPAPAPVEVMASPSVEFVNVPMEVAIGKPIVISWKVNGADMVTQSAVHYSTVSNADVVAPTALTYQSTSPKMQFTGDATKGFETSFAMGELVTVYVRAHASIGGMDYWSDEKSVQMVIPTKAVVTE